MRNNQRDQSVRHFKRDVPLIALRTLSKSVVHGITDSPPRETMPPNPIDVLPKACQIIKDGIQQQLHWGMQIYVSQKGRAVCEFAMGQNLPGEPLSTDTLMLWLSSGKPLTAVATLQFAEKGKLSLDGPVAQYVPEFAVNGKEQITIRDVLTHQVGLRPVSSGWPQKSWEQIIAKIAAAPFQATWTPGEDAGYDPSRTWFILAEVLQRIDGRTIDRIVREDICEPLGTMDCWMSIPGHIFKAYGDRIGITYSRKNETLHPTQSHEKEVCKSPSPGGSMRGPASSLGRFYEMLLAGGLTRSEERILTPESIAEMIRRQRKGKFDRTFQHIIDFGLGVMVNSNRYGAETVPYGFGRHATKYTFGHGGAQSSIGFADPKHHLVVVAIANGCPGEELHNERFRELNSAIYEDLGLAK